MQSVESRSELLVRAQLMRLPEFDPDPGLWARIDATNARRISAQRNQRLRWLASGIAASVALFLILPGTRDVSDSGLAEWQQRSQSLEQEWRSLARQSVDSRSQAQLRLIDLDLQSAYDRGATESELAPLWKLRIDILSELIERSGATTRLVTRI